MIFFTIINLIFIGIGLTMVCYSSLLREIVANPFHSVVWVSGCPERLSTTAPAVRASRVRIMLNRDRPRISLLNVYLRND
jgi:hypothetical protein